MAKKREELPRIIVGSKRSPTELGGSLGKYVPPGARYDYKPPSVFAEYRALTIVFVVVLLAGLVYGIARHKPHDEAAATKPATAPMQPALPKPDDPVYVEPIAPR